MKILIGQVMHETNTFSSVQTDMDSFKAWDLNYGQDVINKHRGVSYYLGGMIDACETIGIEYIPMFSALAPPSGLVTLETYNQLKRELIEYIKQNEDYDAVCLALHGAGVVDGIEDFEGDLLASVREVIGDEMPLVVTLDLHANVSVQMVNESNIIVGNVLYPHSDCSEIGYEAVTLAKQLVEKIIKPTSKVVQLPLIIPTFTTDFSPMKELNDACFESEQIERVIDCTIYHGFPYTNIEQMGVSVIVTTDNDEKLAKKIAEQIATEIWNVKDEFFVSHPSPKEGLQLALEHKGQPVILNETSDNPGAGAPADGTYLLKAMIEASIDKSCLGFMLDPEVVEKAQESGPGSFIDVELGGKTDKFHGDPLQVTAYVKNISDGQFIQSSPMSKGSKTNLGKSARLIINGVDVIVISIKAQVMDDQMFLLHGIDISNYKVVGVKSSNHFRAAFNSISSKIITVDSPGLSTYDLSVFKYTKHKSNYYPFQKIKTLEF